MNIQRFHAPTAREALALARAAFGATTMILSNRQTGTGVEVMASTEEALSPPPLAPSWSTAPVPQIERRAALAASLPYALVSASGATTEKVVQADVEQLAMSTLSFQDYVRERMLRRQTEPGGTPLTAGPSAAVPQAQLQVHPQAEPQPFFQPSFLAAPATPVLQQAPVSHEPALMARELAPAFDPVFESTPMPTPVGAPMNPIAVRPTAPESRSAAVGGVGADATRVLMAELDAMKRLMEERFNTLSWLSQARRDPVHSNLMLKLARAGYSPALAREVLEPLTTISDGGDAVDAMLRALEQRLGIDTGAPSIVDEGGTFALIGATGVGKTTTIAKLASQCASQYGASSVGLVTLDVQRAGAHEQLRALGRELGIVAHKAYDRVELQEILSLLSGKRLVLVDTAGIAPRDPQRRDLLDLIDVPGLKRVVVLNAGAHGDTLDEIATAFAADGTYQAVLSKVDEAAKIGPALDTLMRHRMTLRGVANGQRVPQDWKAADARELIDLSVRVDQCTPIDPVAADMDFYFSPAACAL